MSARPDAWTFRPALQLMGGRLVGYAATFFVPIVLVRLFDQEAFGTYKQLFLVYTTLFGLAQVGMAESLFYFLPLEPRKSGRFLVNALLGLLLSGLVVLAALTLGAEQVAVWLNNPALAEHLPLIGGCLFFMLAAAGLEITLLCRHRYLAATASYALSDVLRAAFLVVPALVTGDLRWLLVGALAFGAGRLGVFLGVLRRGGARDVGRSDGGPGDGGRGGAGRLRPDRSLLVRQLAYSLPFQLAVMVEVAGVSLHQYAVSHWFDTATFAVYAVGCLQIPLAELAASSAGNVLMVGIGDARKDGDPRAAREIWTATTRKLALLLFPAVTLLLLVARDLIPFLFTDLYLGSVPVFMVWTAAVLLGVLQTDAALRAYAQIRFILVMNLVRLGIVAATIAWAISTLGLVGAVSVTVLGTLAAKGLALARIRRLLGCAWSRVLPWRDLLAIAAGSLAAALPAAWLAPELERGTLATLLILGAAYLAVLVPLLVRCSILREGEVPRGLFRALARQPRAEPSETS